VIDLESLNPPEIPLSAELRWLLLTAFASEPPPIVGDVAESLLPHYARRLGLSERTAARLSSVDLSPAAREPLRGALRRSIAACLMYHEIARHVAAAAARRGLPVVFLKGFALFLLETAPVGARPFADLDVLVPERGAPELFRDLRAEGFAIVPGPATEQHLPALRSHQGGLVEIHFSLRGLRQPGGSATSLEDLDRQSLLRPLPEFAQTSFVPRRIVLGAHALAHGFQQHLLRPRTYPLFRMVGDLSDLLPDKEMWLALEEGWGATLAAALSTDHLRAVRSLCLRLAEGEIPNPSESRGAGLLLGHLLAGCLDDDYARSLGTRYLWQRLRQARRSGELSAYLRRKFSSQSPAAEQLGRIPSPSAILRTLVAGIRKQSAALVSRIRLDRRSRQTAEPRQRDSAEPPPAL
jgi:hypothetical protein